MNRLIYSALLYLAIPLVLLRLVVQTRKNKAYGQRWWERFGFFPALSRAQPVIWVHSVSVGETIASAPMVRELLKAYPHHRLLITTMTPTGSDQVRALHKEVLGSRVEHVYCPYDLPDVQSRFLNKVNPVIALVIDTELWPNTVAACKKRNIPMVIVNARLSARSAKGYKKLGGLTRAMLRQIPRVACQNPEDGERFIDLGLPREQLRITGSVKFDLSVSKQVLEQGKQWRASWEKGLGRPVKVIIAASTHSGEDQQILDSYKALLPTHNDLLLVIVPRHQERFDEVYKLVEENQLSITRHSQQKAPTPATRVILGDTMGQMMPLLAASDMAFVGGSLVERGGHNMMEPAALGLPVLSGPHVFNFTEISKELEQAGGLKIAANSNELSAAILKLLDDEDHYQSMGKNALAFIERNRGALRKTLDIIDELID